jgi:hypothetical protein
MTRIVVPTPTRGDAPSHSPPDTRYAPGLGLARALGWFGVGLGLAEILAPRAMARATGVRPAVLWAYGVREIVCGVGILTSARPAGWMWARVAGDVADLAALGAVVAEGSEERQCRALTAAAAVAGVTALDVLSGAQLTAAAKLEG